ncbi:MAG: HAD-IA family hydrolase [Oscillospiraceae bacterium]|nr:HAD-IA family hydrolase [Oscillospiraceae bacterium]
MNFQKIRAVLFDLDGTLLDTIGDIRSALNEALRSFGYPVVTLDDCKRLICNGVRRLVGDALPEGSSEEQKDAVLAVYQPIYAENIDVLTAYYSGAQEILKELTEKGYRVGVITNKTQKHAEYLIWKYFPETEFEIIWGNNGVRPLKPSTESGVLACETLRLSPEEILFIGDGDTDIRFAVNNGFGACGVSWGYRDAALLRELGADVVIDDFGELGKLLNGVRG